LNLAYFSDSTRPTDYILAAYSDPDYSLKGRTLASVLELCRLWHATTLAGNKRVPYKAWSPNFTLWEISYEEGTIRGVELTNTRALAEEGRAQRHCVYTYADWCLQEHTAIVSLRWLESRPVGGVRIVKRITVEVDAPTKKIWQVKGMSNRAPNKEEMAVVRLWMKSQGLT
jgi:hypothetical protein